jgi:hypothetical protein
MSKNKKYFQFDSDNFFNKNDDFNNEKKSNLNYKNLFNFFNKKSKNNSIDFFDFNKKEENFYDKKLIFYKLQKKNNEIKKINSFLNNSISNIIKFDLNNNFYENIKNKFNLYIKALNDTLKLL